MKKLLVFCLFISLQTLAFAQVAGNATHFSNNKGNASSQNDHSKVPLATAMTQEPVFQAEILYNAKPTHYLAIFAVTQEADNLEDADRFMNQRLENFRTALQKMGISDDRIFFDFVSSIPKYEVQVDKKKRSKTANEVPIGFQLKKNVHVSFTDCKILDRIISAAAASEIYDLAKVEVSVKDLPKIYAELQAEALKIVQTKAEPYKALGLKMVPLNMTANFETYYPDENYESYTASATDFSELQQNQNYIKGKMGIKYAAKNTTVYYNRLPYDQFDNVINPDFTEPPIQIHYKLIAVYWMESPEYVEKQKASEKLQFERTEAARKDEIEVRKLQAQNPPKTCCDGKN